MVKPLYDLLLCGGRLIDPRHGIDGIKDIAIAAGRIAMVADNIPRALAVTVRDAMGLIVTPGLIDLHTHVYHKATSYGVDPDLVAQRSAVTTMVDAGSAGAANFAGLRDFIMTPAQCRILAYLNISFAGIFAFDRGLSVGEAAIEELLDVERCVAVAGANRQAIVGVKVRLGGAVSGELGLLALDRAIAAAERLNLPVMSHIGKPPPTYDEILARLRPGDILTHCFRPAPNAPVDDGGKLLPSLYKARERGILFDIGHGMGAFGFASAAAAIHEGMLPDIVSSDVHGLSINGPAFDLLHTMSKLMMCGVPLPQVIAMTTARPAAAMGRMDIGHLGVGAMADLSLLALIEARFPFEDVTGVKREGAFLLQPRGVILGGNPINPLPRPWETPYLPEDHA